VVSNLLQADCCDKYYFVLSKVKGLDLISALELYKRNLEKGGENEKVASIIHEV